MIMYSKRYKNSKDLNISCYATTKFNKLFQSNLVLTYFLKYNFRNSYILIIKFV